MPDPREDRPEIAPVALRPRRTLVRWTSVLLLILLTVFLSYLILSRRPRASDQVPQVIASYQGDYQENGPPKGWRYLWNASGPIGEAANYLSLQWDGRRYTAMQTPEWPKPAPVRYLRLTEAGGHPAQGMGQSREAGNEFDRFVIAAFTVPETGKYWITNSSLSRNDGILNGSIHLRVFVNNQEIGPLVHCHTREGQPFDRALGKLSVGDTIYVAVGPNEMDTNDSFGWDFSIAH